jgi:hypothetical protein
LLGTPSRPFASRFSDVAPRNMKSSLVKTGGGIADRP